MRKALIAVLLLNCGCATLFPSKPQAPIEKQEHSGIAKDVPKIIFWVPTIFIFTFAYTRSMRIK